MILTKNSIEKLQASISNVIIQDLNWQLEEIKLIGSGVINAVFLIREKNLGELAVRTPWRAEENMMDKHSSGIISLKKEVQISEHCHNYSLPVPKVHKLHLSSDINFLISDFISGDNSPISSFDIGQLTSKIHKVPLGGLSIIDQHQQTLSQIISHRIINRVQTLRELTNSKIALPCLEELQEILDTPQADNCLLHLDVRRPNLIGEKGSIKAIIDWDNAFIGNPIMELMRIAETEELHVEEFLKGYNNMSIIEKTDKVIQFIYRLDTALMLSILFISFVNDVEKREHYLKRVDYLSTEIMNGL
ncbi:aminoglycoside phosphotransferase family protein [Bacillus sp. FJAT-49705]|uniref:Aminoglycoside phosphotransferase family protein n=1 Tax=Cytobacillus citreus TaxID=2833586 RepID=A0ABS5NXJ0_9BACI|nr:aminoglycoside phosphotransferase family protein [Cytobacillus citreus]MBS4191614.1 aminoglycoside phosphotransferase family protein [Cytobacillus citreus]